MEYVALAGLAIFLTFVAIVLVVEANMMRIPHSHNGKEVSRHERAGHEVIVYLCRQCGLHFSVEQ